MSFLKSLLKNVDKENSQLVYISLWNLIILLFIFLIESFRCANPLIYFIIVFYLSVSKLNKSLDNSYILLS